MSHKKKVTDAVRAANRADAQSSTSPRAEQGVFPKERMSKAEANRKNSLKSTGPTSATGKQNSRMNAHKNGFFSKDVVVTAAGERVGDFEQLEAWVRADRQPTALWKKCSSTTIA